MFFMYTRFTFILLQYKGGNGAALKDERADFRLQAFCAYRAQGAADDLKCVVKHCQVPLEPFRTI